MWDFNCIYLIVWRWGWAPESYRSDTKTTQRQKNHNTNVAQQRWGICCVGTSPSASPRPHSTSPLVQYVPSGRGVQVPSAQVRTPCVESSNSFGSGSFRRRTICSWAAPTSRRTSRAPTASAARCASLSSRRSLLSLRRLGSAQTAEPGAPPDCRFDGRWGVQTGPEPWEVLKEWDLCLHPQEKLSQGCSFNFTEF